MTTALTTLTIALIVLTTLTALATLTALMRAQKESKNPPQNFPKNLQKRSNISPKITIKSNSPFPSMSAATLLGPNLVLVKPVKLSQTL